jgi:branched-chain amino acid transport system ATP-binding protein
MLLEIKNVSVKYGSNKAIRNITMDIAEGSIVTIIGANGSGKTTIFKSISKIVKPSEGEIWFSSQRIDKLETHQIVRLGISQIPEGRKLFPYLTVLSNLKLGAYQRRDKYAIKKDLDKIFEQFPILWERRNQLGGTLSGGQQQMLAIGRGLMAKPKLLLMDEPSLGLAPIVVKELKSVIRNISQSGITILLAEQNFGLASSVGTEGYVLEVGEVVLKGNMQDLIADKTVQSIFR